MSTKTHKPADTSDILNNPQIQESNNPSPAPPNNPSIHKSNNPFPLRARCGKVARLPKEIRDQINEMLLDGVPHAQIIQKLKENFSPPPSTDSNVVSITSGNASNPGTPTTPTSDSVNHATRTTQHDSPDSGDASRFTLYASLLASLTPHHITTWKKYGGYRDWLRDQQRIQECKIRHELTLDLARSAEGVASYQAAPKVAVAEICQTIVDLGPEGLKQAMQASPMNCFRLLNALARLINSGLKCEHHIVKHATETRPKMRNGFTPPVVENMETALNMM